MKNKFLSKTVNKSILFSIIVAVLIVASVVVSVVFGIQYNAKTKDATTMTVQMNRFFYNTETDLDSLEKVCKDEFAKQGLKIEYTHYDMRETGGDTCEIVYVFANTEDSATKAETAKTAIKAVIETKTAENGAWYGNILHVTTGNEVVQATIPLSQTVKASIAATVLSVLAGVYVAIRYGWKKGIVAFLAPIVGMALSVSVILLARIPMTSAMFYAVAVGGLISEVFTVFTLFKLRSNETDKGEEKVINSVAMKEMLVFSVALGVALVLVGAIATSVVRWFAVCALIALVSALYTGVLFVPSVLAPMQKCDDKKAEGKTASGYVGAKKKTGEEKEVQEEQA